MHRGVHRPGLLAALLVAAAVLPGCEACQRDAVVSALPPSRPAGGGAPSPPTEASSEPPAAREGLVLDAHALAGRSWSQVRDLAVEALGGIEGTEVRPDGSREIRLARGAIHTWEGKVLRIEVELPRPMRRSEALSALGISPAVRRWYAFSREFRARHHAGFELIVLRRAGRDAELVTRAVLVVREPG